MVKKIVLITTGQPATNPRLIKEATALAERGYKVTVLYCFWAKWGLNFDVKIQGKYPEIEWIQVGGDPLTSKVYFLLTRFRYKAFRILQRKFSESLPLAVGAEARGTLDLLAKVSKIKADLYIAHNLGALPVAAAAAAKFSTRYSFDAEDLHRGQVMNLPRDCRRVEFLENTFLPGASFITAASPLIAKKYAETYSRQVTVINNVFSASYLQPGSCTYGNLITLFWFSQTIETGRGLEDIIKALTAVAAGRFTLTLLGNVTPETRWYFDQLAAISGADKLSLNYIEPVHPDEIFSIAAKHDIGLALEPGRDLNNQYALSNKIFSYLLAGNAIIFSATPAQKTFFEENPAVGSIYTPGDCKALSAILNNYLLQPQVLQRQKQAAKLLAKTTYNWELEKLKFLARVNEAVR